MIYYLEYINVDFFARVFIKKYQNLVYNNTFKDLSICYFNLAFYNQNFILS